MSGKKTDSGTTWVDPDEAPELTEEWFAGADEFRGDVLVRKGGRPKSDNPKQAVNIRLDPDLLERLRASGPGWQSRINEMLRKAVGMM